MLKDFFKNAIKKQEPTQQLVDKIKNNLVDGFVDIKAYKGDELVYHDAGDNVVTDWMRHAIMILLTGDSFSKLGNTNSTNNEPINTLLAANHSVDLKLNRDGYILNGEQYFWDGTSFKGFCSKSDVAEANIYPLFPTKVLFGTGKEYTDFDSLANDTKENFPYYYDAVVQTFGGGSGETQAETVFNGPDASTESDPTTLKATLSLFSYKSKLGCYVEKIQEFRKDKNESCITER